MKGGPLFLETVGVAESLYNLEQWLQWPTLDDPVMNWVFLRIRGTTVGILTRRTIAYWGPPILAP